MRQGTKGQSRHACMPVTDLLGPQKHEEVAQIGRIPNILEFRECKARRNS